MYVRQLSTMVSVTATQTRPNNTTAYAAGDVVGTDPATNLTFSNVLPDNGVGFVILGARLRIDVAAIPAGMAGFRLHLYNAAPTAIADNTAFDLIVGDRGKYLGYVTISTGRDNGATVWYQDNDLNFTGKLAAGSATLYGVLETIGAYTPTASVVKTSTLNVAPV